jgi:hypothetical protein
MTDPAERSPTSYPKPWHFLCVLLLVIVPSGWAQQPAASVVGLQSKLKPDDELKIIDRKGKATTGRFVSMSGSSVTLMVRGNPQEFSEATIREIKQRRPHGARNMLLGAAIGGVAGGATAGAAHPGADGANGTTTMLGVLAGSGVGAGIVALKHLFTRRYDTVFVASRNPGP